MQGLQGLQGLLAGCWRGGGGLGLVGGWSWAQKGQHGLAGSRAWLTADNWVCADVAHKLALAGRTMPRAGGTHGTQRHGLWLTVMGIREYSLLFKPNCTPAPTYHTPVRCSATAA